MEQDRRGCAVVVEDEEAANARPHGKRVVYERTLGEIALSGGDHIRIRWLRLAESWPVLAIWFYRRGPDGRWLPIQNRGVRIGVQHLRKFLDAVNAAAPDEAEWRRYTAKRRRSAA